MENYLEAFIEELLHINEAGRNKLIDLEAGDLAKTYYLSHKLHEDTSAYALRVVNARFGKTGNTILRGSAIAGEQIVGRNINDFEWRGADGVRDAKQLSAFIDGVYKELNLKGNNPLFFSVGALRWKIAVSKDEIKEVVSPLLIFPIRLIRSVSTSPVCIEFVEDDAYFNPCLIHKLRQVLGDEVADGFPHPNGGGAFDEPVSLEKLGTGEEYFACVGEYVKSCKRADAQNTVFEFEKNVVAIAQYNHDELCMYYDIKRNREKIYAHPLVKRVFTESRPENRVQRLDEPDFVLPHDSVQEDMIRRVAGGESLIIKGPPGTGKTLTIANMIAALLSENKKVLLSSKKLSALSEVYAKLPDPLRKFVMLMVYETEAQAAKVKPSAIKGDLRDLLRAKREYAQSSASAANKERDRANAEKTAAITFLADYADKMFDEGTVAGVSYYEALDTYFKNDLDEIPFAPCEAAAALDRRQYAALAAAVKDAGIHFAAMTGGGAHSVRRCPWWGVVPSVDSEAAFGAYGKIAAAADGVYKDILSLLPECGEAAHSLNVCDVYGAMRSVLRDGDALGILSYRGEGEAFGGVRAALRAYLSEQSGNAEGRFALLDENCVRENLPEAGFGCIDAFSMEELENVCNNAGIFYGAGGRFLSLKELSALSEIMDGILELNGQREEHLYNARKIFTEDTCNKEGETLLKAHASLCKYVGAEKPKALDFKAKKFYEKLSSMSFLGKASFKEVVEAVGEYAQACICAQKAEEKADSVYKLFRRKLEKDQLRALFTVFEKGRLAGSSAESVVTAAQKYRETAARLSQGMRCPESYTAGELAAACRAELARRALEAQVLALFEKVCGKAPDFSAQSAEKLAVSALAVRALFENAPFRFRTPEDNLAAAKALAGASEEKKRAMEDLFGALESFGKNYFESYYTRTDEICVGDLKVLALEADDRAVLSAAMRYQSIVHDPANALPLYAFFAPFEDGRPRRGEFEEIFEHSFFALAVSARMKKMGLLRNGLGRNVMRSLDKLAAAESKIESANVALIESKCLARIQADDPDFAFLASERDPSATLRSLFKKYARQILKLKKCFILSPSTASVLFRPEEYEDFDVVIIDEASQLEPVNLLPVLFRSKQCVIVGDEWQMPPIKHFVSRYEKQIVSEDGTVRSVLEPEISALTLALRNQAFRAEELVCHYRSKTESLIAFSQKEFYPYMRTFPAAVPMREGLGFKDVYVPDGRCVKGVNLEEARAVVKLIGRHFERCFDEEKGILRESFGVVAFGEEQAECIEKLVRSDGELCDKMCRARDNFEDVPEKLMFFKTIETVQGQETAHLILSLTYGRTADGRITNSYGQLNRDKLGKCIFNVAVTRAQSSVTVVHSVQPEEITGENVRYIRNYLEFARKFGEAGRDQFVSEEPGRGFLRSVADHIVSRGIDAKRVAFNYGVTEGSVRMPIAVLSEDMSCAQLGIWCEVPTGNKYNYLDYNMRYFDILKGRGWNLHRICAHDWADNAEAERESLDAALKKYVK